MKMCATCYLGKCIKNWYIVIKILRNMLGHYTNIIKVNSCSRNVSEN